MLKNRKFEHTKIEKSINRKVNKLNIRLKNGNIEKLKNRKLKNRKIEN